MRRIKLTNNSVLEHKNGKPFTDYGLKKYKYYDPKEKIYMQLTAFGTIPYTPYLDKVEEESSNKIIKKENFSDK